MRQTTIVFTTALVILIVAIWSTIMIAPNLTQFVNAAPSSISIDVMQIMRDAKNLPEEKVDAY